MEIGRITWIHEPNQDYGYLIPLGTAGEILFHNTEIRSGRIPLKGYHRDCLAAYESETVMGKPTAAGLRPLSQLDTSERAKLYHAHREQIVSDDTFVRAFSDFIAQEPLPFFFPYLKDPFIRRLFAQKISELPADERQNLFGNLSPKVLELNILCREAPQLLFSRDLSQHFHYAVHINTAKALLWERCHNGFFPDSVLAPLCAWLKQLSGPDVQQARAFLDEWGSHLDWTKESDMDTLTFIQTMNEKFAGWPYAYIPLSHKPQLLFSHPELCRLLDGPALQQLPLGEILQTTEQVSFFVKQLRPGLRWLLSNLLPVDLLLASPKLLRNASTERLTEIVSQIDWNNITPAYMERYQALLSLIEADTHEETAVEIAASMRRQRAALSLPWWKRFTDSVKIRILIYCSNFREERQSMLEPLREIYRFENTAENLLIVAAVLFLSNIYLDNRDRQTRQAYYLKNFQAAHTNIIRYIRDCFRDPEKEDISPALNTLLDKCQQGYSYAADGSMTPYFCDARPWAEKKLTHCYNRPDRPGGVCRYFNGADLTRTKFRSAGPGRAQYQDQYLMDFLLNIGGLDALPMRMIDDTFKKCTPTEYPYRIAAYVNRLIDMKPHMVCRACKQAICPNFRYAEKIDARISLTVFNCPNAANEPGHDTNFYLNYCYHCQHVIDSRECKQRTNVSEGQYLCMRCGGAENVEPGTICPKCRSTDRSKLIIGYVNRRKQKRNLRIACTADRCNHNGARFQSVFEPPVSPLEIASFAAAAPAQAAPTW